MNSLTSPINTSFINRAFLKVLSMLWVWSLFKIEIRRYSFIDSSGTVSSKSSNNKPFLWDNFIMSLTFPRKIYKRWFSESRGNLPLILTLSIPFLFILMKSVVVLLMGHFILSSQRKRSKMLILNSFSFFLLGQNLKHQDLTFSLTLKISKENRKINLWR